MNPLDLAGLTALMERTEGRPEVVVGLVDGPIAMNHPDLTGDTIREVPGKMSGTCTKTNSAACLHGTFVAGILCAKRGSAAPALCPDCTLLAYPIFAETASGNTEMPSATPEDLAAAILACIEAGARILNLSLALTQSSSKGECALGETLDHAARRGVLIVAAAGNQGTIGSTIITGHPWVIPVAACDLRGKPVNESNLGHSIGRRGLRAPGDQITSLGAAGPTAHARRNKCRGAFCDGCDRLGLVGISRRDRGPIALGLHARPCWGATHGDTPIAGCVGSLPSPFDNPFEEVNYHGKGKGQRSRRWQGRTVSGAPPWFHKRRAGWSWRRRQAYNLRRRHKTLRWLRAPCRRPEPLDGLHTLMRCG